MNRGTENNSTKLQVGLVQYAMRGDQTSMRTHILEQLERLATQGTQLACLPEMHDMPYFACKRSKGADASAAGHGWKPFSWSDDYGQQLLALAQRHSMVLVLGVAEFAQNQWYNRAYVVDADGSCSRPYDKTHIPQDPGFYERDYFVPAQENYLVHPTRYGRIAPLICFDQWFPEAARICALEGAQIIVYPTAIGTIDHYPYDDEHWAMAWRTVQQSHAIVNGIHAVAVNRLGHEDGTSFFGTSFVSDAFGNIVLDAKDQPFAGSCTIDLGMNERIQSGWGFHQHRRPDTYQRLVQK